MKYKKYKGLFLLAVFSLLVACTPQKVEPYRVPILTKDSGKVRVVDLTLKNDNLALDTNSVVIDLGEHGLKLDIENLIPEANIYSIDNYGSTAYIRMTDSQQLNGYEIMLSRSIPEELDLGKMEATKENPNIVAYSYPGFSAGMAKLELGQLYIAVSGEGASKEKVNELLLSATNNLQKFSKDSSEQINTVVNIDTLGVIDSSKLKELQTNSGYYYSITDKIFRLYTEADDIPYLFITNIDNSLLNNTYGSLRKTEYPNLYIDKNFDEMEQFGYKTFSIMSEKGMYTIKLNEKSRDSLYSDVINVLGITKTDEHIPISLEAESSIDESSEASLASEE